MFDDFDSYDDFDDFGSNYARPYSPEPEPDPTDLRWAWLEIDLNQLRNNYYAIRHAVAPGVKVCCIVKADCYGHGAVRVAKMYETCGADYFAVATVPEAVELREAGISKPMMLLSQPPETAIPTLLKHDIMPSVYDSEFAIQYGEAADAAGKKAPFHLAINTGMNRIGVLWSEAAEFADMLGFHRALEIAGTFTHFATADEPDTLEWERQASRFDTAIKSMRAQGVNPGIVHCANSASILKYSSVHFDMVRPGIILYGLQPSSTTTFKNIDLKPAMSVKARITDVRSVPIGEGVSYGLRYRSRGYAKICTIPLGYADGFHRACSGKVDFLLRGNRYRQVGSICMDQCMFEVEQRRLSTNESQAPRVGEVVTIVGRDGDECVTFDEMAAACGTINYELACDFGSMRLPRVYV